MELFDRLYQRRMLIRLVGVKFSHLVGGVQQLDMFEDTPEMISLYNAMDNIRQRFGKKAIRRAVGMGTKASLPAPSPNWGRDGVGAVRYVLELSFILSAYATALCRWKSS